LEANLAALEGDFVQAEKLARAYESKPEVAHNDAEAAHGVAAWLRVEIATETGRKKDAADIAADFRSRSPAWSPMPVQLLVSMQFDHAIPLLDVLEKANRISQDDFDRARKLWIARWTAEKSPHARGDAWVMAYAREAATPEEARQALELLPRYEPLPPLWDVPSGLPMGRVYLLAGKVDEALAHLRRATKECSAVDHPFDHVRAQLVLGQALEEKKDIAGACAAYRVVIDRWGHAKPRSVTADAARARVHALRCPQ
jgi:serine/threonine-protein kinase